MRIRASRESLLMVLSVAIAIALAVACGPSIRRTYQSDNAFARCFDLDYRPGVADVEKEMCWKTWLAKHVYNQPGDKTRYANLRLDELAEGISVPGPPGPPGQFDQRPRLDQEVGLTSADGGVATEPAAGGRVLTTSDGPKVGRCESDCDTVFQTCQSSCQADAGVDEGCANACTTSRTACLSLCSK